MMQKLFFALLTLILFQSLQAGILRERLGLGDDEDEKEALFSKEVHISMSVMVLPQRAFRCLHPCSRKTSALALSFYGAWRRLESGRQKITKCC